MIEDEKLEPHEIKDHILDVVHDLVLDFVVYDRKSDEILTREMLEKAVKDGTIVVGDIVDHFHRCLLQRL
jgi:hypothetical protein